MLKDLPYDTLRDFAPVSLVASFPMVLAVHPDVPAKTTKEFIDLAKSKPGQLLYGSAGNATTSHLAMELFRREAGIDIFFQSKLKGGVEVKVDGYGIKLFL